MSTLIKIIVASILSVSLFSCNLDINTGVNGNGNVSTKNRILDKNFEHIEVSSGLEVQLTKANAESVKVQADENVHDLIETTIVGKTLKITTRKNINGNATKKVIVNYKDLSKLSAASGSSIYGTNSLTEDHLEIELASGSSVELELNVKNLVSTTASGSNLRLTGSADKLRAKASSGSTIHAKQLRSSYANVKTASGANISVHVSDELIADASSGSSITYIGKPKKVNKIEGVSANINSQD